MGEDQPLSSHGGQLNFVGLVARSADIQDRDDLLKQS